MTRLVVVGLNVTSDVPVGLEQGAVYVLTGPDGSRAVFNNPADRDFVGWLTAPPGGLDSPEVRESADLIVEGDGGVHGTFYFGRRPWTLEGQIDPDGNILYDYRERLVTALTNVVTNPTFTTDVAGWTPANAGGSGAALTRVTGVDGTGGCEASFTATAIGQQIQAYCENLARCAPGDTIALRGSSAAALNLGTRSLQVRYTDSTGAFLSQPTVATTSAAGWVAMQGTHVAPAGAAFVGIGMTGDSLGAGDTRLALDEMMVVVRPPGGTVPAYFDGDTFPTGDQQRTSWIGAPNASASVLANVFRDALAAGEVTNRRITRLQRASRALRGDARLEWTPLGGVPVMLTARRQQPLRVTERLPKKFLVAMVSAEPRIFGQVIHTQSAPAATTITARNGGDAPAPPVITLRDAWTDPILTNTQTGEDLRFTANGGLTMGSGDVLVVDVAAGTVALNGTLNRYGRLSFPDSEWWEIQPGDNQLTATGGAGGSWQVDWRDAWI